MRSSRSGVLLASMVVTVLVAGVPAAQAKKPAAAWKVSDIRVTPKRPQVTGEVTVSFIAGKLRPDQRYDVWLQAAGPTTEYCTAGYAVRIKGRKRPGSRVTVMFRPGDSRAWEGFAVRPGLGRFCPGDAVVWIGRADAANTLKLAGSGRVTLTADRDYPKQATDVPVKVTVLDGSALTVKATGRPDRSMPVGGELRGVIPGNFRPNTDIQVVSLAGALRVPSLRIDALCAGTGPFTTEFPVVPGPSNLLLKASGEGTLTVLLVADRLSLAGCAAPATPSPTTLVLTGKVNADGLLKFPISGAVTGVPIADGVTADVTAGLVLNVDLSGKG